MEFGPSLGRTVTQQERGCTMRRILLALLPLGLVGIGIGSAKRDPVARQRQEKKQESAADAAPEASGERALLLRPARVFDGVRLTPHEGWEVLVRGGKIISAGPAGDAKPPRGTRV